MLQHARFKCHLHHYIQAVIPSLIKTEIMYKWHEHDKATHYLRP